jgi:phosphoribosylaminoimidazolecarboxamide formyltransferase/IMP cyclohydrolase
MVGRWALVSVSDKQGLSPFVRELMELGFEVFATGGTAKHLAADGIPVRAVGDITGSPEMLGGRVKTLHPRIHAALLARRDDRGHMAELRRRRIPPIDLVVANLYPFGPTAERPGVDLRELQEEIDIGGVALLRAAAKNWDGVGVVVNPQRYPAVLEELRSHGDITMETRQALALEAFAHTSAYDAMIYNALWRRFHPEKAVPLHARIAPSEGRGLRYGENPYQEAAFYPDGGYRGAGVGTAEQLMGR